MLIFFDMQSWMVDGILRISKIVLTIIHTAIKMHVVKGLLLVASLKVLA